MEHESTAFGAHVLILPFPAQGHINPMLNFGKRIAFKGIKTTLSITVFLSKSMNTEIDGIGIDTISDGYDDTGIDGALDYISRLKEFGSKSLADLIKKHENASNPITCLVYDCICPWALDVGKEHGLVVAPFFTQACSVSSIYYQVFQGVLTLPIIGPTVSVLGLPTLDLLDLPTFIYGMKPLKVGVDLLLGQFSNIDKADWLLFNSFDKLESEVLNWMAKLWPVRTVGPAVPSMYLDKRIEGDKVHSLNVFKLSCDTYINWLNSRETGSVIYMSFGSFIVMGEEQLEELAWGLRQSSKHFLWVVREKEQTKLPKNFLEEVSDKGLVVSWCSQLEVLAHEAVGCFVTHCGWNSTLEALSLGVPVVAVPQVSDQTTNAKLIEDVWGIGVRAKVDDKGILRREELESCVRKVMEGEGGEVMKRNGGNWKEFAKDAVDVGGSSDANIDEFISSLVSA